MKKNTNTRGFTLIELVVFIVVATVLATGLFTAFSGAVRGTGELHQAAVAAQLARERMELILAQRRALGFGGFTGATYDPCTSAPASTQSFCASIPAGYTVASGYTGNWLGDANYKIVTVTVSGAGGAQLTTMVANY